MEEKDLQEKAKKVEDFLKKEGISLVAVPFIDNEGKISAVVKVIKITEEKHD